MVESNATNGARRDSASAELCERVLLIVFVTVSNPFKQVLRASITVALSHQALHLVIRHVIDISEHRRRSE